MAQEENLRNESVGLQCTMLNVYFKHEQSAVKLVIPLAHQRTINSNNMYTLLSGAHVIAGSGDVREIVGKEPDISLCLSLRPLHDFTHTLELDMSTTETVNHDYTTGAPRHHHSLYLEDGNFVMQIENAIFKIHRSVLAKYSSVIGDMLNVPQGKNTGEGTDEKPLVVTGDSVQGWELLLGWRYESPLFKSKHALSGEQLLSVLPIAHKYCMEEVEENILGELNSVLSTAGYVDLMVAAQLVGSDPFYQKALNALKNAKPELNLAQSKRIGVEATHAILTAIISNGGVALTRSEAKLAAIDNQKCRHCSDLTNWKCTRAACGRHQTENAATASGKTDMWSRQFK